MALTHLKHNPETETVKCVTKALKTCVKYVDPMTSFNNIHIMCNRATPNQMMKYKSALCLFKLYNCNFNTIEFSTLNFNQVLTSRQNTFKFLKSNRTRIVMKVFFWGF